MWLKIKQEVQTAGVGPCFLLPIGQAILEFRFFGATASCFPETDGFRSRKVSVGFPPEDSKTPSEDELARVFVWGLSGPLPKWLWSKPSWDFILVGEFTNHFRTFFSGWIGSDVHKEYGLSRGQVGAPLSWRRCPFCPSPGVATL